MIVEYEFEMTVIGPKKISEFDINFLNFESCNFHYEIITSDHQNVILFHELARVQNDNEICH